MRALFARRGLPPPLFLVLLVLLLMSSGGRTAVSAATPAPIGKEPPITTPGVAGDYLRAMHASIHFRWVKRFIEQTASGHLPVDPLDDPVVEPNLEAEVLFVVRWDGTAAQATVSQSSGVPAFDAAAVAATTGGYPVPPIELYGDDGVVHVRWVFRRDERLCSVGEIRRFEAPLAEALPRLLLQGRTKEALLRATRDSGAGSFEPMSEFARAYLARPFTDPAVEARAAASLARGGNAAAVDRLRRVLKRPEAMPIAAPALAAANVDVCAIVRPDLEGASPEAATFASRTLRVAGVELAGESPCVGILTASLKAGTAPAEVRADMMETLAVANPSAVRRPALEWLADPDPKLRATAARVLARPHGGRPTLYRLQPLIADPSPEVRAAVAAGLVRACGDLATDYLQPIFKGRDVAPLVAMAEELGRSSSPGSAELLAKLQKRPEPELRIPLMAALAARQDPPGRAMFRQAADAVKKDAYASAEARRIVYAAAELDELDRIGRDPLLGIYRYRALLRAGRQVQAVDWLVAMYDRLGPETLVEALGAWLTAPPGKLSVK